MILAQWLCCKKLLSGFLLSFTQHLLTLTHAHKLSLSRRRSAPQHECKWKLSGDILVQDFYVFCYSMVSTKKVVFCPRKKLLFFPPFSFSSCCITITFGAVNCICEFLVGIRQCLLAGILKKASVIFCLLFVYLYFRASF